jgi:hypothetical protein
MPGFDAAGEKAHITRSPSSDIQPNQLSPSSGSDKDDPPSPSPKDQSGLS